MSAWLSKSDFTKGLQCELALWLHKHRRDEATSPGHAQQLLFDNGNRVDAYAQDVYGGGVLISSGRFRDMRLNTDEAIGFGARRIYQATFSRRWGGCKVDILDREDDGTWTIREVKMSTKAKEEHLADVAFQTAVLREEGLNVRRALLVHVNNRSTAPELEDFFGEEDLTEQVEAILLGIKERIDALRAVVDGPEPTVRVGRHCDKPYTCAFKERCWANVPEASVFTIPGIGVDRLNALLDADIWRADKVPDSADLTDRMRAYVDSFAEGPSIDSEGIRDWLSELTYPLHFLDFETENPPIPRHDGVRPYQQVPFQFSCHVLHEDGQVEHTHHLHADASDPREGVAAALKDAIGPTGDVLVYNAGFERGILKGLAQALPDHAEHLTSAAGRIRDQWELIKTTVLHPGFLGSYSLKAVVPVLCPDLSYADLDVQGGDEAQATFHRLWNSDDLFEGQQLSDALESYCTRDTEAQLALHRWACRQADGVA